MIVPKFNEVPFCPAYCAQFRKHLAIGTKAISQETGRTVGYMNMVTQVTGEDCKINEEWNYETNNWFGTTMKALKHICGCRLDMVMEKKGKK